MAKYFGTDGFRGKAGISLTAYHAYRIGRFLGWYYRRKECPARILIGKDTRRSSYMLESAVASGLAASGADAYLLHVTTTPSVSFVTRQENFDCGVMISASHNPYYDNGIKLINRSGEKMEDPVLDRIEEYLNDRTELPYAAEDRIGRIIDYSAGRNRYIGHLISLSPHSFKGLRIGLDCANGSAWMIGRSVFDALGAKTYVIGCEPDGQNINRGVGSTHIDALSAFVRHERLDAGFAFDGDADRCLAVDEAGNVIDGDAILYILACEMEKNGSLTNHTVVTTVMSNMGLYRALAEVGIRYEQTAVGDKYVYEAMQKTGDCLGGEQSGHIILSQYATTGDGILTALKLMEVMLDRKLPLSKLAAPVVPYPQVLKNIRTDDRDAVLNHPDVKEAVHAANLSLGERGRVLLRASGTEPVIRLMVEAQDAALCNDSAAAIERVILATGLCPET